MKEKMRSTIEQYKLTPEYQILSEKARFAIDLAHKAGAVLQSAKGGSVEVKDGTSNVVTTGDKESNNFIVGEIQSTFPSDAILSEERKNDVENPLEVKRLWVVDPCDGSTNYSRGKDEYYVAIALVMGGVPVVGVAHNPKKQKTYFAEKGKGAYVLEVDEDGLKVRKIHASTRTSLKGALIETSMSYQDTQSVRHNVVEIQAARQEVAFRPSKIGSSVGQLCSVAEGVSDGHFHSDLQPWDYAAAQRICLESGAVMTGMDGSPFNFTMKHNITAATADLARKLADVVKSVKGDPGLIEYITKQINDFAI